MTTGGDQAPVHGRATRWFAASPWILLGLGFGDLLAFRSGLVNHSPAVLAALMGAGAGALALRLGAALLSLARGRLQRSQAGELVLLLGALVAILAGLANWLLGLHGFVILTQGESARLHQGAELQAFETGPLTRLEEMAWDLRLDEVEIVAAAPGGFFPRSRLAAREEGGETLSLAVSPGQAAAAGPLRLHQGAFGFAPRIVILKQVEPGTTDTVFDEAVPFLTERHGPAGVSFTGQFTIAGDELTVDGVVDLASLDPEMKGHVTLHLSMSRAGRSLGRGALLPGHFAELGEGYRVGFAGLEKWSEIVVSRRDFSNAVLAGAGLALLGGVLCVLGWWRAR